ncbi:MAG: hypothetical protein VKJ05_08625 [Synechococcaceae cyanobacterium]|nr:hypothetical protein [Synechococcaceae cyanobacterium]
MPLPFLEATLLGIPLVALALVLLTGDYRIVAMLVGISVVCTAGIGGVFWLGLALLVGLAVLYVLDQILRLRGSRHGLGLFDRKPQGEQRQARQAVVQRYVARRLATGADPARVRQDLLAAGWEENQLQAAFLSLRGG